MTAEDYYRMGVRLRGGPLDGQVRNVRMYYDYNQKPPEFVQFPGEMPAPEYPHSPVPLYVQLHTYKSTLWRKGWNEWYEWDYVEEI